MDVDTKDEFGLLRPGDLLSPFLHGGTLDGRELPYEQLWQKRNVVWFVLPARAVATASPYLRDVNDRLSALTPPDTSLVISDQAGNGLPLNCVVIADRWGEVVQAARLAADPAHWPPVDEIIEWVEFVRAKCPECPP